MTDIILRICEIVCIIVIVGFLGWVVVSYIDILAHNLDAEGYIYPKWNFFAMLLPL